MTTKSLPAGNLFPYLMSETNYKGEDRKLSPRWLWDTPETASELLEVMAPPHVAADRRRRWVPHCRDHLTHLITGFSEGHQAVAPFLRLITRATECLVLAGLPPDCLSFVWCEHPQAEHSHLHCGLVRALLPTGGCYEPRLSRGLAVDFSWLVSWRLGLSDPVAADRARLIHGGEFSYKGKNRELISAICGATQEHYAKGKLKTHADLLRLLEKRNFGEVLASPDWEGRIGKLNGQSYRNGIAIKGTGDTLIWLFGKVCHPDFTEGAFKKELEWRRRRFDNHIQVFRRFRLSLGARIGRQRRKYPGGSRRMLVTEEAFAWLNSYCYEWNSLAPEELANTENVLGQNIKLPGALQLKTMPVPEIKGSLDLDHAPEADYPFYSDLDHLNHDITVPRSVPVVLWADPADEEMFWPRNFADQEKSSAEEPSEQPAPPIPEASEIEVSSRAELAPAVTSSPDRLTMASPEENAAGATSKQMGDPSMDMAQVGADEFEMARHRRRRRLQVQIAQNVAMDLESRRCRKDPKLGQGPGCPAKPEPAASAPSLKTPFKQNPAATNTHNHPAQT